MLAKTLIVYFRLSFADQGKQTYVFHFRLRQTNGSLPFPFSVCSKQREFSVSVSTFFVGVCMRVFVCRGGCVFVCVMWRGVWGVSCLCLCPYPCPCLFHFRIHAIWTWTWHGHERGRRYGCVCGCTVDVDVVVVMITDIKILYIKNLISDIGLLQYSVSPTSE
jgi:hypothetical protein